MNKYFSIGEISKMKGIGIKSLRYYDKIGVLKPAYVNEKTGYRYYTIEQLFDLDIISLCVELNIPLKNLEKYFKDKKVLNLQKLLIDSKKSAEEKIKSIQSKVEKIENIMENIKCYNDYKKNKNIYKREIKKRTILYKKFEGDYNDKEYCIKLSKLLLLAEKLRLDFTYGSGMIYDYYKDDVDKYIFIEILNDNSCIENIREIPKGNFLCKQSYKSIIKDSKNIFQKAFEKKDCITVIETDMFDKAMIYGRYTLELQMLI